MRYLILPFAIALAAACQGEAPEAPAMPAEPWQFDEAAPALRAVSCPEGRAFGRGEPIEIEVAPIEIAAPEALAERMDGLVPAGAWALSAAPEAFGGLSGLAALPSGNLLTVSDQGHFVWIAMDAGAPSGGGHIGAMLDAGGEPLTSQRERDAEGLALRDGLALVSLERGHRVLAYDLEACGTNALGAPVAALPDRPAGMARALENNGGAEGLALTEAGDLLLIIETLDNGMPFGRVLTDGGVELPHRLDPYTSETGTALSATGIEVAGETLYLVSRAFEPGYGTTVRVARAPLGGDLAPGPMESLLRLDPSVAVDNFEGVLVRPGAGAGGVDRLYILSDDNFSRNQRTLLFAFDLAEGAGGD